MKMLFICLLAAALPFGVQSAYAQTAAKPKPKGAARTIALTGDDKMKFDKTELTAKPGETIRVVLKSIGTMPKNVMGHNFVLLKLDADVAEFNTAAFSARATDFIPPEKKDSIIANTALAGPGETVEVTFKVPAKAGSYNFLCSFPGHYQMGMRGKLIVK
jgi:azurin